MIAAVPLLVAGSAIAQFPAGPVTQAGTSNEAAATPVVSRTPVVSQRATVILKDGLLTVDANNSDLQQILQDISRESGMKIQGNIVNTRVFGRYGPIEPSELLTDLLAGMGYNIMMVGSTAEGAPRELTLSPRTGTVSAPQVAVQEEPELGPGAIAHPPPEQYDLPQQRLYQHNQRLQQMHDAQVRQEQLH